MTKESFLRGAVILAAASTLSRIIGMAYMVILPRLIYDDGMGLLQLVKPLHYFAAVLAISGMPVAVSKLIAEKAARGSIDGIRRVFRLGLIFMTVTGSLIALILLFGADFLAASFAGDQGVQAIIAVLGPACFFLALSAAFRGYFQGLQCMLPTAVSQIVDQVVRVISSIALILWLRPSGIEQAVVGVAWGSVFGEFAGWLVLVAFYLTRRQTLLAGLPASGPKQQISSLQLGRRLVLLAAPVVMATILSPIMQLADSLLIPIRMQVAGFSPDAVRESLGHFGMALTLAQFPNIITVALATTLVPAISEAWTLGSKKMVAHRAEEALRTSLVFGLPAFAFLSVLAVPAGKVLFGYPQAGAPLRILALGTITLGLIQSATGILQGLGEMTVPVRNFFFGVLLKFILNYLLVASPSLGILGAAWSTTISWVLVAFLNMLAVFRRVGVVISLENIFKPALATLISAVAIYYLEDTLVLFGSETGAVVLAVVAGLTLYFLLLTMWGTIQRKDLNLIPFVGERLSKFLYNWGFLRK